MPQYVAPPCEYSSAAVAKFVLRHAQRGVSQLRLHKMLYYIQGNSYRIFGKALIREDFEAWQYGPVEPNLYRHIGARGAAPISESDIISRDTLDENCHDWSWLIAGIGRLDQYSARQLVNSSHAKDTPWDIIYRGGEGRFDIIPKPLIELFFRNR